MEGGPGHCTQTGPTKGVSGAAETLDCGADLCLVEPVSALEQGLRRATEHF